MKDILCQFLVRGINFFFNELCLILKVTQRKYIVNFIEYQGFFFSPLKSGRHRQ